MGCDVFLPISYFPNKKGIARGETEILVLGRLRPGVDVSHARLDMAVVARRLEQAYPDTHAGRGVEMIMTLGTGFGTGLYVDGRLAPHLELAHHPFRKGETYDEQLGNAARKRVGNRRWNRRVRKAIESVRSLTSFDRLYLGGGNARKIDFTPDPDVTIVGNEAGIAGGIGLWRS